MNKVTRDPSDGSLVDHFSVEREESNAYRREVVRKALGYNPAERRENRPAHREPWPENLSHIDIAGFPDR